MADCTPNVAFVLEDSRSRSEHPARVRADSRLTAFLTALGAVAVGAAVQVADGYGRPAAFVWLTVAVVAVLLAVVLPTHRTVEAVLARALPPDAGGGAGLAGLGDAAAGAGPAVRLPCRAGGRRSWLAAVVAVAAALAIAAGRGVVRHVGILALLATHLALGIWTIRHPAAPSPMIDVYMFQRDSVAALLAGVDPTRSPSPTRTRRVPTTGRTWSSTAGSSSGSCIRR